jgi:hypothetical protein
MDPRALFVVYCAAVVLASAAGAQTINTDQMLRLIRGDVILERAAGEGEPGFTDDFLIEECAFSSRGVNPYFSLEPCYQLVLRGEDDGEKVELIITVLDETREIKLVIDGRLRRIRARVIEERESKDGELFEISRNYYARCKQTGDIYYFGEDVCFFEEGECVGTGGSWLAGANGATPGIIMPGTFLLGSRYFQEVAPGIALDRAEHIAMGETLTVPAGVLEDCVTILETTPLEPGAESEKVYAEGIGLIKDGPLQLVSFGFDTKCGDDD